MRAIPWSPAVHSLFPRGPRAIVRTVLLATARGGSGFAHVKATAHGYRADDIVGNFASPAEAALAWAMATAEAAEAAEAASGAGTKDAADAEAEAPAEAPAAEAPAARETPRARPSGATQRLDFSTQPAATQGTPTGSSPARAPLEAVPPPSLCR